MYCCAILFFTTREKHSPSIKAELISWISNLNFAAPVLNLSVPCNVCTNPNRMALKSFNNIGNRIIDYFISHFSVFVIFKTLPIVMFPSTWVVFELNLWITVSLFNHVSIKQLYFSAGRLGCAPLGWSGSGSVNKDLSESWCIKRTAESTMDSPVPLMHHDPYRSWFTDPNPCGSPKRDTPLINTRQNVDTVNGCGRVRQQS